MNNPATDARRGPGFLLLYALANAGGVIAYFPLLTLLLPMKVDAVAGASRLDLLTVALIAGAVAASLSNIVFGWLGDRSHARGVGRRAWIAGALAGVAAAYGIAAIAASSLMVILAVVLVQVAVNALLSPMLVIMAEEFPDAQKGVAGGLLALGTPFASALGTMLVASVGAEAARIVAVPLLAALCVVPLLFTRARPIAAARVSVSPNAPRKGLAFAWGARLLVQVAGAVLSLYLLYYLDTIAPGMARRDLAAWAGRLLTVAAIVPLPIALMVGRLSDRSGRRKPFLLAASGVAAAGVLGMAGAGDLRSAGVAFAVYVCGSQVFLALHAAFAMQLLPDPARRGRDLGLLNLANTLPGIIGPAIAWSLATPRDFHAVMLVLAGLTFAGGLATLAVRGQR